MKKTNLKLFGCIFFFCMLMMIPASAAWDEGCGDHSVSCEDDFTCEGVTESEDPPKKTEEEKTEEYSGSSDAEVYFLNGKKYVVDRDWGLHYLTGYAPNADGSRGTRSGRDATAGYTVSSTCANLGKAILIRAEKGSSRYDGVYLCEDTGGPAVETGKENTMNVPVVDIFFDTEEEAQLVTEHGWITARIYILKEVK